MTNHIVDLSESPAFLHINQSRLIIERHNEPVTALPLAEVAVLIAAHAQVKFTQAVFAGLAKAGGVFVACDEQHLPVGLMLPLDGHHWQVTRFAQQAALKLPTKKRLWQQIVKAKVLAQAGLLEDVVGSEKGLRYLAEGVRSGDPSNVEAQAARRYWSALFGDAFRRNREAADANLLLNYGYGVLRAIVARAICGAGLHPAIGLHHHNRSSGYPLADDLMEPFRPIVDRYVVQRVHEHGPPAALTQRDKRLLLLALLHRIRWQGEQRTLFDAASRMAASLISVISGKRRELELA